MTERERENRAFVRSTREAARAIEIVMSRCKLTPETARELQYLLLFKRDLLMRLDSEDGGGPV